ncbi:hypothetical protein LQZ19_02925 [Treponema primitia]|uniref:RHS repeat-associated core domain-containing protein n=1 Tax=Treponema primitia TaxID=88058 RepID=UPI003980B75D
MRDESGEIRYQYGKLGEVIKERREMTQQTESMGRLRAAEMEYRSDYLGRMQEITYPDGEVVRYGYDYGGNVVSVKGTKRGQEFTYVDQIGYDEWGQRVYIKLGNGVETSYRYDENRRWLENIQTQSIRQTGNPVLQNIQYQFDRVGNVAGYRNEAGSYQTEQEYGYDPLYQLVYAKGVSENRTNGRTDYRAQYEQEFRFDRGGLGNLVEKTSITANSDRRVLGDELDYRLEYEYAAGYVHRAERIGINYYQYDENGNVTAEQKGPFERVGPGATGTITELGNGTQMIDSGWGQPEEDTPGTSQAKGYRREYVWNERNELKQSRDNRYVVSYTYGQDGQRSGKYSVVYDGGHESETLYFNKMWTWRYDGTINDRAGRNSKHIYLDDSRILTKIGQAEGDSTEEEKLKQYYYHTDHLGSAQLITDRTGQEYERIEYTPYGELWIEKASTASYIEIPYRFTGKERDEETGLYYYGARYLDSKTSRWLSTDPAIGDYIPGAPVNDDVRKRNQNLPGMGGVFNTINSHLYHYAGNNPIKYTDPDGKIINYVAGEGASNEDVTMVQDAAGELMNSGTMAGDRYKELNDNPDILVTINVNRSGSNNSMPNDPDAMGDGTGSGSEVNINIDNNKRLGAFGPKRDIGSTLAHEVSGHAYSNYKGRNGTSIYNGGEREEANASALENEYRSARGLPQRSFYTWPLKAPQFDSNKGSWFFKGLFGKKESYRVY